MKRFLSIILVFFCVFCQFPVAAFAADNTYSSGKLTLTKYIKYTDEESGLSFTVPTNWVETPMSKEREYLDVKFTSNTSEGLSIIFASEDIFELEDFKSELSGFEKLFLSREMMGNDLFTPADIAKMLGCKESNVSVVTFGDREYFCAEFAASGEIYGLTISIPSTCLVRCENGYFYMFLFSGNRNHEYYDDFESLVTSAKYPIVEDDSIYQRRIIGTAFLFALIVLIALVTIIVSIIRKRNSPIRSETASDVVPCGCPQPEESPIKVTSPITTQQENKDILNSPILFCHQCGCKINQKSHFCHHCGTVFPAEEDK